MKLAVLISIQPQWVEMIASGAKTVELRKSRPIIDAPFTCYVYQTKKKWFFDFLHDLGMDGLADRLRSALGMVVGEFTCDQIDYYVMCSDTVKNEDFYLREDDRQTVYPIDYAESCLDEKSFLEYGQGKDLYGWHISNLQMFGEPLRLNAFRKPLECHRGNDKDDCTGCWDCEIERPPQSWCYVQTIDKE